MSKDQQLYRGGEIYTVDPDRPEAQAVAVRDGRIVAVGSEADCRAALGPDFETFDLRGRVLLPGFIDTHLHFTGMVTYRLYADLSHVTTISELKELMSSSARELPPGEWVTGLQFEDHNLKDPRPPDRHDLDAAVPDRPAIVVKADGHTVIANSRAMAAAGVTASTPDPGGGKIDRDAGGAPTGTFWEAAVQVPLAAMPMPGMERIRATAKACFQTLAAHGLTSVGVILQTDEEGVFGKMGAFDVLLMNALLELAPVNLCSYLVAHDLGPIEAARKTPLHQPELGAGHRIAGLKFWADGALGSHTAYLTRPFADRPDQRGFLMHPPEEMYRRMLLAHQAGLQLAIHAIGDAAVRTIIELYDRLLREHPRPDHRHRLEHASLLDPDLIAEIARLGLTVSCQPLFIHNEKDWLIKRLGPDRARWVYPFRALLDAGVKLAGASDAPICSTSPLEAIQCAVTREGFETQQAITAPEAIKMFTLDAAHAQGEDAVKGNIAPGKRADLVILSGHPARVPADQIAALRVEATIRAGRVVYPADGKKRLEA